MTEPGDVLEWKIENLNHWCMEVHGVCIHSPRIDYPFTNIELYPKGMNVNGQGEHLVVRLCGMQLRLSFSVELSFCSSDGSLLCSNQQVNAGMNNGVLVLPPGPKFEDVLLRIRKDFITVKFRVKRGFTFDRYMCTTINVFKLSLKINPGWIEEMKSNETRDFLYVQLPPNDIYHRMWLKIYSENDTAYFMVTPPTKIENPFAVEMIMCLTRNNEYIGICVKDEHVFRDKIPWTFPDPLEKKELDGKGISLFLCLKTRDLIQSPLYINWANSSVSIAPNNTVCFSMGDPSTDPVTFINDSVEVLTKDSASQMSLTSAMPDDSVLVLSKELMCLYQDQDFSDITLKCDNVSFPVHRAILSARSPIFKTMLSTDMAEAASGEVDIGDLDPSTLSLFLSHLYTGAVEEELQSDRALKLYYAADKYQVPSLKRDCSKFLCSNVSVSNVCDILSLADRHRDDQLRSGAQEFILKNFNDVLKSNEWESFMCREPMLAVKTVTHFAMKDSVVRKHDSNEGAF